MVHFCENHRNHGKIKVVYIAANLPKLMVFQLQKNVYSRQNTHYDDVIWSHIPPVSNKAHGLW